MLSRLSNCEDVPNSYRLDRPELAIRGLVFGRNTDSDIVLNTESLPLLISRKHASLSVVGRTLCIQDTGSTNGTYVNEHRLRGLESKPIVNGAVISFGGPKLIIRDGQQHNNPFVYVVSAAESVIGHTPQRQVVGRADSDSAAVPAEAFDVATEVATVVSQPTFPPEQLVDLTRTSSDEAGPSSVVDLTSVPDIHGDSRQYFAGRLVARPPPRHDTFQEKQQLQHQPKRQHRAMAGQKRTKPVDEPNALVEGVQALPADGGAKQALENEFECTICRDFMVATHSVVPCGHMFCGGCLSEWLQKNPTCPKCRAAATAPPVRTMGVDNVLESIVEKGMSAEELQERKERQQHWESHAPTINARMKGLFQQAGPSGHQQGYRGHQMAHPGAMMHIEALAAMHGVLPMHLHVDHMRMAEQQRAERRRAAEQQRAQSRGSTAVSNPRFDPRPPAPPAVSYTVKTNTSPARVLCKGCRNPIAVHSMEIGYGDRNQMRWYHLGCLGHDKWQEAAMPGRLTGLPSLHPSQQENVQRHLRRPSR